MFARAFNHKVPHLSHETVRLNSPEKAVWRTLSSDYCVKYCDNIGKLSRNECVRHQITHTNEHRCTLTHTAHTHILTDSVTVTQFRQGDPGEKNNGGQTHTLTHTHAHRHTHTQYLK